jgi:hypothetical protein
MLLAVSRYETAFRNVKRISFPDTVSTIAMEAGREITG